LPISSTWDAVAQDEGAVPYGYAGHIGDGVPLAGAQHPGGNTEFAGPCPLSMDGRLHTEKDKGCKKISNHIFYPFLTK
jgi:hypothetical protein